MNVMWLDETWVNAGPDGTTETTLLGHSGRRR